MELSLEMAFYRDISRALREQSSCTPQVAESCTTPSPKISREQIYRWLGRVLAAVGVGVVYLILQLGLLLTAFLSEFF